MFDQVSVVSNPEQAPLLCPFIRFPHLEHFGVFLPRAAFVGVNNA